jgi:hypothetical protein
VPVRDQLLAIDTAALERMLEIRSEQSRIEAYRKRAEDNKSKVEKTVWRRVMDDYARRHASLEQKVVPLKAQVREEFQKVRALLDRVTKANEDARLTKQELEFRHEVGELDDSELEEQIQAPDGVLAQCRTDLEEIEELKARFVEAFKPDEDIDASPAPGAMDVTARRAVPSPGDSVSLDATNIEPSPLADDAGATRFADDDQTVGDMEAVSAAAAASVDEPAGERTFLLPLAALLGEGAANGEAEYRLGALNIIGRSDDAQIQLNRPGVSRRHALVSIGPGGFTIKDLKSQNGTLVNGERITETTLADGDKVEIGDVQLTFRAPWPTGV